MPDAPVALVALGSSAASTQAADLLATAGFRLVPVPDGAPLDGAAREHRPGVIVVDATLDTPTGREIDAVARSGIAPVVMLWPAEPVRRRGVGTGQPEAAELRHIREPFNPFEFLDAVAAGPLTVTVPGMLTWKPRRWLAGRERSLRWAWRLGTLGAALVGGALIAAALNPAGRSAEDWLSLDDAWARPWPVEVALVTGWLVLAAALACAVGVRPMRVGYDSMFAQLAGGRAVALYTRTLTVVAITCGFLAPLAGVALRSTVPYRPDASVSNAVTWLLFRMVFFGLGGTAFAGLILGALVVTSLARAHRPSAQRSTAAEAAHAARARFAAGLTLLVALVFVFAIAVVVLPAPARLGVGGTAALLILGMVGLLTRAGRRDRRIPDSLVNRGLTGSGFAIACLLLAGVLAWFLFIGP